MARRSWDRMQVEWWSKIYTTHSSINSPWWLIRQREMCWRADAVTLNPFQTFIAVEYARQEINKVWRFYMEKSSVMLFLIWPIWSSLLVISFSRAVQSLWLTFNRMNYASKRKIVYCKFLWIRLIGHQVRQNEQSHVYSSSLWISRSVPIERMCTVEHLINCAGQEWLEVTGIGLGLVQHLNT